VSSSISALVQLVSYYWLSYSAQLREFVAQDVTHLCLLCIHPGLIVLLTHLTLPQLPPLRNSK